MSNSLLKPKTLFSNCITIVSKYVDSHDPLRFELIDKTKGVYAIRNSDSAIIMDGEPQFYILRIKNCKGLYLHVSVTLKPQSNGASIETNHEFEGISIQFLQGTGKLFCRAEWDVKKKKDKLEHPQPHWHWGGEKEKEVLQGFDVEATQKDMNGGFMNELAVEKPSLPAIDFKELHYAMAAKWTEKDSAVEDFSSQHLYNWLKNCIINVVDQYNYQVNKGSFTSAKEW